MGLDMWAYKVGKGAIKEDTDFSVSINSNRHELIHEWRKHPNLHGWMENLYREKGGDAEEFNCCTLRLTKEDLMRLEDDLIANDLPETQGFFFGESTPDRIEGDLKFVKDALEAIDMGYEIYYESWW